MEKNADKK